MEEIQSHHSAVTTEKWIALWPFDYCVCISPLPLWPGSLRFVTFR